MQNPPITQCLLHNVLGGPFVLEKGVEPSRPFGHTDLNRARLPFRHSSVSPLAYTPSAHTSKLKRR